MHNEHVSRRNSNFSFVNIHGDYKVSLQGHSRKKERRIIGQNLELGTFAVEIIPSYFYEIITEKCEFG